MLNTFEKTFCSIFYVNDVNSEHVRVIKYRIKLYGLWYMPACLGKESAVLWFYRVVYIDVVKQYLYSNNTISEYLWPPFKNGIALRISIYSVHSSISHLCPWNLGNKKVIKNIIVVQPSIANEQRYRLMRSCMEQEMVVTDLSHYRTQIHVILKWSSSVK